MKGKRGVSVILSSVLLISIAIAATAILYSMYAPQLFPQANTDKILEDIRIVLVNATPVSSGPFYWNYSVSVQVLNRGVVSAELDRVYIEDLNQNWLFSRYVPFLPSVPDPTILPGQGKDITFWVNLTYDIFTEARIFKVVSLRGLAASYLFIPATSSTIENASGIGDSSYTRFNISGIKFFDYDHDNVLEAPEDYVMGGWVIILRDISNTFSRFAITAPNGSYAFSGLDKGIYVVEEAMRPSNASGRWNYSEAQKFTVLINSKSEVVNFSNFFTGAGFSISGNVFNDNVAPDGIRNLGEPGLSDWIVTIRFSGGSMFMAVKTDATGDYAFNNLEAGDYTVEEILVKGWSPRNSTSASVSIVDWSVSNINFGNYWVGLNATEKYSISGHVYNDTNGDGVFDVGENGLGNWFVTIDNGSGILYGASTDSSGFYSFLVNNGTYTLQEVLLKDWYATAGTTKTLTVAGLNYTDQDFGNYYNPLGTLGLYISGTVFNDTINQGIFDRGTENGFDSWIVNTVDSLGIPYSAITDSNGTYIFTQLLPGTYNVSVVLPPGFNSTTLSQRVITLTNVSATNIDFGAFKPGKPTISGRVFNDTNHNRVYDPGIDYNLVGWLVYANSSWQITDSNGFYLFGDLDNDTYIVQEIPNVGWWNWTDRVVTVNTTNGSQIVDFANTLPFSNLYNVSGLVFRDDDHDGVYDNGTGDTPFTTTALWVYANYTSNNTVARSIQTVSGTYTLQPLNPGDYVVYIQNLTGYTISTPQFVSVSILNANKTVNFGIYQTSSGATYTISGHKYNDTSPFGVFNTGDLLLNNIGIYLYSGTNTSTTPLRQNYTYNGYFFFDDVAQGNYTLVELLEPGWTNRTARTVMISLTNHSTVDFFNEYTGFQPSAENYTVSGILFNDIDNSRNYTAGDGLLTNWLVILNDNYGFPIDFAFTNSSGGYAFTNLERNNYSMIVQMQSGWTNTTPYFVPLVDLNSDQNVNFGFRQPSVPIRYSISGYKFNDKDGDGIWNITTNPSTNETGLSGWVFALYSGGYAPYTTPTALSTTDANGRYLFTGLLNGSYSVVEILQANWTSTTGRQRNAVVAGGTVEYLNFGNQNTPVATPYYISGFKFNDLDNSTTWTPGEAKLNSWVIWLNDASGYPIRRVVTGAPSPTGYYNFTGLTSGSYVAWEQLSGTYTNTTLRIVPVNITTASNSSVDFGNRQNVVLTYTISGRVFNDTNTDGIFNDGNATMTNTWTVYLYTGSYAPFVFPYSITTTTGGLYSFSGLSNGVYTVVEVLQAGYTSVWSRGATVTISGSSYTYADFFNMRIGPQNTYKIEGYKFNDTDGNLLWNSTDEAAMSGWEIAVFDSYGWPMGRTTTSSSGYYSISGLPNGNYTVMENLAAKAGWTYSKPYSLNFTISSGNYRYDFGNFLLGTAPSYNVYGWVFNDTNVPNGVQDPGEPGLSTWSVSLYNGTSGSLLGTRTTNGSGFYVFPAYKPGLYRVDCGSFAYWVNTSLSSAFTDTTGGDRAVNFSWKYEYTPVVPHRIFGRVYNLTNTPANGLQNWLVTANNGTVFASTLTDSTGNYSFNLYDGSYTIEAVVLGGYTNITASIVNVVLSGADWSLDFGMNRTAPVILYTVSGIKYNDTDMAPIANWIVTITDGSYWKATTTNSSGVYLFTGLPPKIYTVEEMMRGGWVNSTPRIININVSTSDITGIDFYNHYSMVVGQNYSIGGLVFNDLNKNGAYDAGTDGLLSNWNILLRDSLGIPYSNTSDINGNYVFTNLLAGNYTVSIIKPNEGWITTTPATYNVTIVGSSVTNVSFGAYDNWFDIQGRVFFDSNHNTAYDSGTDFPLSGWLVNLTNSGGQSTFKTTDANGMYYFTDQPGGIYTLSEIVQQGWNGTTPMSVPLNLIADTVQNFGNDKYFLLGQYYTQTRGDWSADSSGFLANNFTDVYLSGIVEIGVPGVGGFSAAWDNVTFITGYLGNSQPANYLDNDYNLFPNNNPSGALPGHGGQYGANVLALQFNVDWGTARMGVFSQEFGNLRLYNYSASVNGLTINQILAIANTVLGSGASALPSGFTLAQFSTLLGEINDAFNPPGTDLTWADQHLF